MDRLVETPWGYRLKDPPEIDYAQTFWDEHADYLEYEFEDAWYWGRIWDDVLLEIRRHLGSVPPRIVDIGCGQNLFARQGAHRNIFVRGLDTDKRFADLVGEFPSSEVCDLLVRMGVNCLTAFNVLEHVRYPGYFLNKMVGVLPPNGLLVIQVPNECNRLQNRLTARYGPWWIADVHPNYFTAEGLRETLKRRYVKIIGEWRTFPVEIFPLVGINYIGNDKLGRRCHVVRMLVETLAGLRGRLLLRKLWVKLDIGREVILFGRVK